MARFTDEKKWSDKWFRSLNAHEKLVWIYLCDNCDIAGFYEVDFPYIAFHVGLSSEEVSSAYLGLSRGYLGAKDSDFIWIKNFLKHQKNHILNENNNCHKGIIKRIQDKLFLFPSIPEDLGANEGLFSPIGKGKGKGKGALTNKGKGVKDKELPEWLDVDTWKAFIDFRKKIKSPMTEHAKDLALKELLKLGKDNHKAILEQSIMKGYKGIFALREDFNKPKKGTFKETGENTVYKEFGLEKLANISDEELF